MAICFTNELIAQRYLTEVFPSYQVTTNIKYGENVSVFPGPTPAMIDLMCDVYEPAGIPDPVTHRPLIIMMHTGSYLPAVLNQTPTGSRNDSSTVEICKRFAKRGYVVANMDYRLGWVPTGSTLDIRRGTLLNAVYRSIQDAKACVRYFRADAAGANTFKLDSNMFIIGGQGTGGYVAINYIALDKPSEITLPKFLSSTTEPTYGFVAGQPYVNQSLLGDFDGYGGVPQLNNPNNSPGHSNEVQFAFNLGGALGDSSWLEAGDAPTVALHVLGDPFAPYGNGTVYVPGNPPQIVVDVSGSGAFIPIANALGNNDCFKNAGFTDPFTLQANTLNGGEEGLYPFATSPPVQAGPWEWFDSATVVFIAVNVFQMTPAQGTQIYTNALLTNPDMSKTKAMAYIDTIMGYLNPRIVYCLNLPTGITELNTQQAELKIKPNPVERNQTLQISTSKGAIKSVEWYDLLGKRILYFEQVNDAEIKINTAGLSGGTYLLKVMTDSGVFTEKILIQ